MKRTIKKVAVIGSGVMGSQIACHFANIGVQALLLDIVPKELREDETKKGLTLKDKAVRNRIVNEALAHASKMSPNPLYSKAFISRITTGNLEDDIAQVSTCDWIIEVVSENPAIKKIVFDQLEKARKPGTLITSNTSGIPLHMLAQGRGEDFQKNFCGTHFFNPPRYLRLLEIIPTPQTDPEVVDFLMHYGDLYLGKTTVLCKDTPAFIANRIGVYGIMALFHLVEKMGLTVEQVDKLTGPALGRPKSATFRTCDVVGLDTLINVANGLTANLKNDEAKDSFVLPKYVAKMGESKWLGDKTGQGFYKKVKNKDGKSEIMALDLNTMEYKPSQKVKFATLEAAKAIDSITDRMKVLVNGKDNAGDFYRASFAGLFTYVSNRIPEISDELYKIDDAMRAGFGWQLGPFETWDAIGVQAGIDLVEKSGSKPAAWVYDMVKKGCTSFYKVENGVRKYYDIPSGSYKAIPGAEAFLLLDNFRKTKTVWENSGTTVTDIGDGVLNLEFHTKMNSIGGEVLAGLNKAIDIAEKDFRGLVVSNEGANFSAGANVALIFTMAIEQDWEELDMAIRVFQNANMRVRYSSIPVVVAPHNMALGGSCEMAMHSDKVQIHAETYMGLVEFGVGLIPGGGGTKEMAVRISDSFKEGDVELNVLRDKFLTIGMAKVSTSAYEAFDLGYLRKGHDEVTINRSRLLADAKASVLRLADEGYTQPAMRKDIKVLGKQGLGMVYVGADVMKVGHYMSEHDKKISLKLGYVLCGGDLSAPALVSEQYLLDLEREAFMSLCGEKKTLERIQSILTGGKILRN
ncbi:MAG TPA: 3-hydroxyacyl-CoA dehydrogenase NAD-binding domain-containing protein [Bacteroidia bacterium]|nr:3-hydroxyacyl-CoA dehydrogenase NAD-binding domain-containing protein [Bacteroidia bacterium]